MSAAQPQSLGRDLRVTLRFGRPIKMFDSILIKGKCDTYYVCLSRRKLNSTEMSSHKSTDTRSLSCALLKSTRAASCTLRHQLTETRFIYVLSILFYN